MADPAGSAAHDRRPIAARGNRFARAAASAIAATGVTPNQISVASVLFAGAGAWALLRGTPGGWLLAAVCVQARLLCNLFDGMVAVEGGKSSLAGALYNEFPDRVADSLLLVPIGYLAGAPWLGWLCALLAALTAYVRLMGGAMGQPQSFIGPMAKQHRMAMLTLLCVAAAALVWTGRADWSPSVWLGGGIAIAVGAALTCATRTRAIARRL